MRGLFRYEQKTTAIHRIDPRIKLILVFSISVLSIIVGVPWLLLIIFLSTLPFWVVLRPSREKITSIVFVLFTMVPGFMFSQSIFYYWGENPTFTLIPASFPIFGPITGGIHVYKEGVMYGFIQSFRFIATVSAALLLVSTAVSFAPTMIEECLITINAMQVRGLNMKGIANKIKALRHLFFPLVVNVLRTGRQIAIAADSRAFRATKDRTYVKELRLKRLDYIFLTYICVFTGIGLYLSLTGLGGTAPGR